MSEQRKTRVLIVGMGGASKTMLRYLSQKAWFETAAVVDVRASALAEAQALLKLPDQALFGELEGALERTRAEVAIINTPSQFHYAQTKAVLEAGLHALVAKPVTNNFEQAVELVTYAAAKGVTLSVGQQMRYNRHYQAVNRFVESGALGAVEVINFLNTKPRHQARNLANMDQPALYEMSCHHFDSLMAVMPRHVPEWIMCDGFQPSWSVYDGPCMVNALVRFSHNLHVLYHAGFSSQADCYELRLEGTKGALRCRGIHMSNDTMTYEFASRDAPFALCNVAEGIVGDNPWVRFLDVWYAYLIGGEEPPFSGRRNLPVFALLSAGMDSVQSGVPVNVIDHPRYQVAFRPWRDTTGAVTFGHG